MAEGDMRIDGKIKGNVTTSGRLVIGQTGEVLGDIKCAFGNIDGMANGNVFVQEILKITKTANINGTLRSLKLIVEEGAVIEAKITMQ
jgi:cytoskeletal protein CcmA (bactofilin family)